MKKLLSSFILVAGVVLALVLLHVESATRAHTSPAPYAATLFSHLAQIRIGMSEQEVVAILGEPKLTRVYPKFEHKTDAQWAALEIVGNRDMIEMQQSNTPPNRDMVRLTTELTHRYHDEWAYQPNPTQLIILFFDEHGRLANIA